MRAARSTISTSGSSVASTVSFCHGAFRLTFHDGDSTVRMGSRPISEVFAAKSHARVCFCAFAAFASAGSSKSKRGRARSRASNDESGRICPQGAGYRVNPRPPNGIRAQLRPGAPRGFRSFPMTLARPTASCGGQLGDESIFCVQNGPRGRGLTSTSPSKTI